jgi:hypothetical protein
MKFEKHIKTGLVAMFACMLLLPALQRNLPFKEVAQLNGAITKVDKPSFTWKTWFDGSFALAYDTYFNQDFGFRNYFVRLNNQLAFSIFGVPKAKNVIVGKQNYLFEENYIKAYYGTDYIGDSAITSNVKHLKFLADTLKSKNVDLIMVFAAGKGSFYPQFFPDKYKQTKGPTNYEAYLKHTKEAGLHVIDFNSYFLKAKDTSQYLLYPKTGIHWSSYGMVLVADSLIKYIEQLRNIDLPDIVIDSIEVTTDLRDSDKDIEGGMNLFFGIKNFPMAYPAFRYNEQGKTKPKVMVVADSYYWGMFGKGLSDRVFNQGQFWFYNYEVYPDNYVKPTTVNQIDVAKIVQSQDVVILMATEATLNKFPWGFTENAIKAIKNPFANDPNFLKKILELEAGMRNSPKWLEAQIEKAKKRKIPLDSMLRLDAIYLYQLKYQDKQ